jgi:hypothetical protein
LTISINSVSARTDAGTANGFYRLTALSNPTDGAAAEFAIEVQASSGGPFITAGMNIQAFSSGIRRIKMKTDQFIINSGTSNFTPFAVTSGQLIANALVASSNISGSIPSGQVSGLGLMAMINQINSLNIATYMEAGVISTAFIGNAQITSAKISDLSANKITAGTISGVSLNIAASAGEWILRANYGGSDGCELWKPFMQLGFSYNLYNPSIPGFRGYGVDDIGVHGYASGVIGSSTNHGVRGSHYNGASGLIASANNYDFYAEGTGTNYGPFTGAHDAVANLTDSFEIGDIVVDAECIIRRNVSNTLFRVEVSSSAYQKGVVGVVAVLGGLLADSHIPAAFDQVPTTPDLIPNPDGEQPTIPPTIPADNEYTPIWNAAKNQYNYMAINALGEGQLNVCGEGGDISVGDFICASSIPGKGMKQSDDIVHSYTVARAREAATFSSPTEIKFVPCIYLCG